MRGLILDTIVLVGAERRRETVADLLQRVRTQTGSHAFAISTMSLLELAHGYARARTDSGRRQRNDFILEILSEIEAVPLSAEIATAAGWTEGELASRGNTIAMEDLIIGVTALQLGYAVATGNVRHFRAIPGLEVVSL